MNDQLFQLYAESVHRDRVAEAERMAVLRPRRPGHRGAVRHALALGLHRLADSIDSSRPTHAHPSPSR
ncbi:MULTISPECIES: hypothetical protein [Nonomuraea]|uniref:Uncharacterized protein n=1 Tax=Nonomuraea mangrovi TaxID=2316207 RepID=A0ABW4TB19_9ACTN